MRFAGRYCDGRTAAVREVAVEVTRLGLGIRSPEGARLATWRLSGVEPPEPVLPGDPVNLRHMDHPDAVLTVADPAFHQALKEAAPETLSDAAVVRKRRRTATVAVSAILTGLVLLVAAILWLPPLLVRHIPAAWEKQLGDWVMEGVLEGETVCAAPEGDRVLKGLADRLEQASGSRFPITVRVLKSDGINAFALPGGQIAILSPVIDGAGSPDEVAGVLAHEIAHVTQRHGTEGLIRSIGFGVAVSVLFGGSAESGAAIGQFGAQLLELSFSRDQEREADRVGAEILARAGMRGEGMVQFFTRLLEMEQEHGGIPTLLSTHPGTAERVADLTPQARAGQTFPPALTDKDWTALKAICESPS